jgi:2-polyprenyl-6-methoxyphenol hydroxylase-like FAD-dependent oxidoreductase
MTVIVVEAGIGGLTTAAALHAAEIHEQARDLHDRGVGIDRERIVRGHAATSGDTRAPAGRIIS